jgi:integral membrane protein
VTNQEREVSSVNSALTRYRVMAYVVGAFLLLLVLVAMPLKYLADNEGPISIIGPTHGFLYMVYLLASLDLAVKSRWSVKKTIWVLLAGTLPFASFIVERQVTHQAEAQAKTPA